MTYEVVDTSGQVVWAGSAKDATAAMTKFRKESGVGFPNKAVFDGSYGVRKVRKAKNPAARNVWQPFSILYGSQTIESMEAGSLKQALSLTRGRYSNADGKLGLRWDGVEYDAASGKPRAGKAKNPGTPTRANHWVLPMAVGAGALYGAQSLGLVRAPKGRKSNPLRTAALTPLRRGVSMVPWSRLSSSAQAEARRAFSARSPGAKYDFRHEHYLYPVKADGSLARADRELAIPYAEITDDAAMAAYGYTPRADWKSNPSTRASRADAVHKLFGGPRHKVTKRFLKGENVGYAGLAVKIVKYGKDQTIIMGTGVPQQAVPTARIEDINSWEWNKRWDKQFWGPQGKPENLSNPALRAGDRVWHDEHGHGNVQEHGAGGYMVKFDAPRRPAGPYAAGTLTPQPRVARRHGAPPAYNVNPASRGPWKSMAEVRAANAAHGGYFFKNKPRRGSEMSREGTIKGPYNGRFIVVPQEVKLSNGWTKKGVIYRVNDDGQIRHVDTMSGAFAWENAVAAAKEMSG